MKKVFFFAFLSSATLFAQQPNPRKDLGVLLGIPEESVKKNLKGDLLSNVQFSDSLYTSNYIFEPVVKNNKVIEVKLKLASKEETMSLKEIIDALDFKPRPAIDFTVTDMLGKSYKLSNLSNKTVVLNFWFTNCIPCVEEIPQLNELVKKNKEVVFIAMATDKSETIKKFLIKHPFTYHIIPDANKVVNEYGVMAFPTHYVIKNGLLTHKFVDNNVTKELQRAIDEK